MKKYKLVLFCTIVLICILTYQMTPFLDEAKRLTLTIFIWATLAWIFEVVPLFVTSLSILLLQIVFLGVNEKVQQIMPIDYEVFLTPFFSTVILLFMGGFALSLAFRKYKLDSIIAAWLLKKSKQRLSKLIFLLLFSSAFCSMWISNTATTLFLMTAILPVIHQLDEHKNSQKALLLAIPIGANVGGMVTPIGTPPNAIVVQMFLQNQVPFYLVHWILLVLPVALFILYLSYVLLFFFFPIKEADNKVPILVKKEKHSFLVERTMVMAVFMITVILWLLSPVHKIPDGIIAIIPIILLFSLSLLQAKNVKDLGWETLLLVGGGISLGIAMKESGLAIYFLELMYEQVSSQLIGAFLGFITLLLSTVISNTAATSLILPIATAVDGSMIINSLLVSLSASLAMALPVSSPPNAIIYASGYIKVWDMIKIGTIISSLGFLVLFLAANMLWPFLLKLINTWEVFLLLA